MASGVDEPVRTSTAQPEGLRRVRRLSRPQRGHLGRQRWLDGRLDKCAGAHRAWAAGLPESRPKLDVRDLDDPAPSCGSTSSTSGSPSIAPTRVRSRRAALHRLRGAPAQLRGNGPAPGAGQAMTVRLHLPDEPVALKRSGTGECSGRAAHRDSGRRGGFVPWLWLRWRAVEADGLDAKFLSKGS